MEHTRSAEAVGVINNPGAQNDEDVRPAALGSGLVVELDRQMVRAVLFGSVDGHGRMIASASARATTLPPIDDPTVAVKQVVRAIEEQIGIEILGPDGVQSPADDDTGVDHFAITGQPVAATRLTIVPLGDSPVSSALIDAAGRSMATVDVVGPGVRTSDGVISGALFEQRLRVFQPDTIVLIEGSSAIVEWSTVVGTLAGLIAEGVVQQVIIIASDHYQQQAAQSFGENVDLRGIDPGEFPPAEIAAALESELLSLYDTRLSAQNPVAGSPPGRYVNPIRAADLVTRFLARRREQSVVSVSSGDGTMVHWAGGGSSEARVRADVDTFMNVRNALSLDPDQIARWLPFVSSGEDLAHWVLNRALRPFTVAESPRDLIWESALLTAPLRDLWNNFQASREGDIDLIIAGGPFASWPSRALAVFVLLNIVQPNPKSGLVEIVLDTDGIALAAGAIGEQSPAMAADAVELDLALPTASVVVVNGSGAEGDLAVRGQLRIGAGDVTRFSVPFGSIHRLPLAPGQEATLALACEPRFSVGSQSGDDDVVFGRSAPLRGSELGIVIDARGRPAQLPPDAAGRAARVSTWLDDLGFRM